MTGPTQDVIDFNDRYRGLFEQAHDMPIDEFRALFDGDLAAVPTPSECRLETLDLNGVVAERTDHDGAAKDRLLLYFHGGGHIMGSIATHRHLVGRLALAAGVTAISVENRLAPEHPYPAGLDDAVNAYRGVLDAGYDASRIVIAGDSAGGNMAAALILKIRELGLPMAGGLYLISPLLDFTASGASYDTVTQDVICSRDGVLTTSQSFLAGKPNDIFTSPVSADLHDIPPTFIHVSGHEVFRSESFTFAEKAAAAGTRVRLDVWPHMPHAWPLFHNDIKNGLPAIADAGDWIGRLLAD